MENSEKVIRTESKKSIKLTEATGIDDKTSISYFVPKDLLYFTKMKKFKYKFKEFSRTKRMYVECEKNIDPGYVLYILHTMCMFFFRNTKKRRTFQLDSRELRNNILTKYHHYFDYLEKEGILTKKYNYNNGTHFNGYALDDKYYDGDFLRFDMDHKTVLKRWKKKKNEEGILKITNKNHYIDPFVLGKLQEDLKYVELNYDGAIEELDALFPKKFNKKQQEDKVKYFRNFSSIENINDGDMYCVQDQHGRLHTNFTCLKKAIREKHLTIEGEQITELDITNSQPLFLAILMKEEGADVDPDYKESFERFFKLVSEGNFYQYMMNKTGIPTKKICKEIIFTVFFGTNNLKSKAKQENSYFRMAFPGVFRWIVNYKKKNNNHKALSHSLQNSESNLIFNKVCFFIKKKYPAIRLFTIHDSICFPKKYEKEVSVIFYKYVDALIS